MSSALFSTVSPDPLQLSPELSVINAARVSYLSESGDLERDKRLFRYLYFNEHTSPFEMAEMLFEVELSASQLLRLTSDSRIQCRVLIPYRFCQKDIGTVLIRIDLNNAIKYLRYYKQPDPIFDAISRSISSYFPWTSEILGIPSDFVNKHQSSPEIARKTVLDNTGNHWLEIRHLSATDENVARACLFYNSLSDHGANADIGVLDPSAVSALIWDMFSAGDLRPLSMFSLQFVLQAPVVVHWQLVRHRTMSFSYQSGRYTPFLSENFYVPNEWRVQSQHNKQASDGVVDFENTYSEDLVSTINTSWVKYRELLDAGVAREQARLFLPAWSSNYKALVKTDLMFLIRFLRLRLDTAAQFEVRMYASALRDLWADAMPITAKAADAFNYVGA